MQREPLTWECEEVASSTHCEVTEWYVVDYHYDILGAFFLFLAAAFISIYIWK